MELTNEDKMITELVKVFLPVVIKDEDIVDFFEQNDMPADDRNHVILWLACATVGTICVMCKDDPEMMKLAKKAKANCMIAETELSKKYNDVKDVLYQLLNENIQEWLVLVLKHFQDLGFVDEDGKPIKEAFSGKKKW